MTEHEYKNVFDRIALSDAAKTGLRERCVHEKAEPRCSVRRAAVMAMACVLVLGMGTAVYAMDILGIGTWIRDTWLYTGRDYREAAVIDHGDSVEIRNSETDFVEIDKEAELLWAHAMDLQAEDGKLLLILDERRFDVTGIWGEKGTGEGRLTCVLDGEPCTLKLERSKTEDYLVYITVGERTELMSWDKDWPYGKQA